MNKWLSEQCRMCGSVNHFSIGDCNNMYAWECYLCGKKEWLDEDKMYDYMLLYGKDEYEANLDLELNNENILYVLGNYEGYE